MKKLLVIVFDHAKMPPREGFDLASIKAAGQRIEAELASLGLEVTSCGVLGDTAETVLTETLKQGPFDLVMIGAGIRVSPEYTELFETLVNVVHRLAPTTRFVFGASRDDTPAAVRRALGTMN